MIHIDSYGGRIGRIEWQNTWGAMWGFCFIHWRPQGGLTEFILLGTRPKSGLRRIP